MSNASVLMSPIWVSMGGVGWLLRQFDRVPYAVLALPLRLAVATVFWNSGMTKLADWNATHNAGAARSWIANPGRRPAASRHDGCHRDLRLPAGLANPYSMGRHPAGSALPRRRKFFARCPDPAHLGPLTRDIAMTGI